MGALTTAGNIVLVQDMPLAALGRNLYCSQLA